MLQKVTIPALVFFLILSSCKESEKLEELAALPIPITNNSVCGVEVKGKQYVYSFGGLGAGKSHSDITLRSFRLDVAANEWTEIAPLPDTMPKIAGAASVIKGKIYIVGGYHVFAGGHEKSSPKVHVYDPVKKQYLDNVTDIPTPIDDHVQAVWNDSLLYIISGWSDSLNVGMVQVFDPVNNLWQYGSALPDEYSYKVFGGSGSIIGDKIYYAGGAGNLQNKTFPIQPYLRIGEINPDNPLDISWSSKELIGAGIYRSGAFIIDDGKPAWIGGASISYNYNGIAYTGAAAEPLSQVIYYDETKQKLIKSDIKSPSIMDMRGVAQFDGGVIIVGGIGKGQEVSYRAYRVGIK